MRRDLLDVLRCPGAHDEAWLVAMVHAADGPTLREADLACPVCAREFVIRDGIARFGDSASVSTPMTTGTDGEDAMRLAALLALTEAPMPVVLTGSRCALGPAIGSLAASPQLWINPVISDPAAVDQGGGAILLVDLTADTRRVPIGAGTLAAAALDATHARGPWLAGVVRGVRQGGRLVAPVGIPVPEGVRELARDDRDWVGEVLTPPSGLVTLRRQSVPA